jgi:hypothetical protein
MSVNFNEKIGFPSCFMSLHDVEIFLLHAFLTDSSSVLSFADSASKICFSFGSLSRLCRPRSSLRTARAEATLMGA